jgi:YVTN family beta-propeller protein
VFNLRGLTLLPRSVRLRFTLRCAEWVDANAQVKLIFTMPRRAFNFRLIIIAALLIGLAAREISLEQRPSFLRPGLKLCAYVANAGDGTVSVVDLVGLSVRSTVSVGPTPSGLRTHPRRAEIWGVSTNGGYVWVLDAPTDRVVARIQVGPSPIAVDFSQDGRTAYVTASGADTLVAIDCATRQIVARAHTGRRPLFAKTTPDGKSVVVINRDDATLQVFDTRTDTPLLALRATIPVAAAPENFVILQNSESSIAFVAATGSSQISVVDLRANTFLTNVPMPGKPAGLFLKPDGGELYITIPEAHELAIINTWTHELVDARVIGSTPARAIFDESTLQLYVSDSSANGVVPVDVQYRTAANPISVGQFPGALALDPAVPHNLLLVADENSNDLAVIRVRTGSLITMVHVGNTPREIAVLLY